MFGLCVVRLFSDYCPQKATKNGTDVFKYTNTIIHVAGISVKYSAVMPLSMIHVTFIMVFGYPYIYLLDGAFSQT